MYHYREKNPHRNLTLLHSKTIFRIAEILILRVQVSLKWQCLPHHLDTVKNLKNSRVITFVRKIERRVDTTSVPWSSGSALGLDAVHY